MADTSLVFDILAKDRMSSTFDKIKKNAGLLGVAIGAMAVKFGVDSVKAYADAQTQQDKLAAAFAKFPALADSNIGRLQALNTALAQKTKFDDDATASGQAVLAQFKLTGTQIEQLTPLLQDYAAKTGKDLPTAATDLGKAMLGQGRSLKAIGIDFKNTGTSAGNLAEIQAGLRRQVGGFAEVEGKSAAGQAEILRNQFGELEESTGKHLVPALLSLAKVLLGVIGFIQTHSTVVKIAATAVGIFAVGLGGLVAVSKVQALILATQNSETIAYSVVQKASAIWTGVVTAAQWAWNAALTANPIGLVVAAIALLVGGLILAYKHSETFRSIVDGAFRGVAAAASFMWNDVLRPTFLFISDAFLAVAGTIIHAAANAFGWMGPLGGKLKDAASKFDEFKNTVNAALNGVKDGVTVTTKINGGQAAIDEIARLRWEILHIPTSVTVGVSNKVQHIPANASGTRNFAGGLSVVGELGPEVVRIPGGSDIFSNADSQQMFNGSRGGGDTYVVNVSGVVGDKQDVVRWMRVGLDDYLTRNGKKKLGV